MTVDEAVTPYHQPKIAPERWPEIRADYPAKTMRQLAEEWGVCQETIRKIIRAEIPSARRSRGRRPGPRETGAG